MADQRLIRSSILTSESVAKLTWGAEVFYRRLMHVADDYGRYDARLPVLRANLYPLQLANVSEANIDKWRSECSKAGLVSIYQVAGKEFLLIHKFGQRLQIKRSKFPAPPDGLEENPNGGPPQTTVTNRESPPEENRREVEENRETNTTVESVQPALKLPFPEPPQKTVWELAEEIYECYPKKENKKEAIEAIVRAIKRGADSQFLRERTLLYAKAVANKERRYIPFPATWYNAERFNNDPKSYADNEPNHPANSRNAGINADAREQGKLHAAIVAAENE